MTGAQEEAMVPELVRNNIKDQYREFKQCLVSEKGDHCLRCSRKENDSPIPRVIHNISAVVVVVLIGSFLFYLLSMN